MSTKTKTHGKRAFVAALDAAFTSPAINPTIRYSHTRGFHVESGIHPADDDDVIWYVKVHYLLNGTRCLRPKDYADVRRVIKVSNPPQK